jgi:hypothetical protein
MTNTVAFSLKAVATRTNAAGIGDTIFRTVVTVFHITANTVTAVYRSTCIITLNTIKSATTGISRVHAITINAIFDTVAVEAVVRARNGITGLTTTVITGFNSVTSIPVITFRII